MMHKQICNTLLCQLSLDPLFGSLREWKYIFTCCLSVSSSLCPEFWHPKWDQRTQAAGELHGGGGIPADPPHQWQDQPHPPGGLPLSQFPQANRHHRLPAAVSSVGPGQPQHALPQPECHPWTQSLLQLCSGDLRDDQPEGHRPVQPEEHHPGGHSNWEKPWALLHKFCGLVSYYGCWVQQCHQWK